LTFKRKRDKIEIVMKAMAPIENKETSREQANKVSAAHFVVFALLFGVWLAVQFAK
jgi:hypothetical protein